MNHVIATLLGHLKLRFPALNRTHQLGNDRLASDGLERKLGSCGTFPDGQRWLDLNVQPSLLLLLAFVQDVEVVRPGTGQVHVAVVVDVFDRQVLRAIRLGLGSGRCAPLQLGVPVAIEFSS